MNTDKDCIALAPQAGFVVKSTTLRAGFYQHSPADFSSSLTQSASSLTTVSVPSGRKIFINLAYASEIPSPPIHDEFIIQRALLGEQSQPQYFVPILVGFGREDTDKAGNPTTVFDAFLNPSVKKRLTEDINYRSYVLEIVLSTLESPPHSTDFDNRSRSLSLSRTLATPNVRFKGPLLPRRVPKMYLQMLAGPNMKSSLATPGSQIASIPPTPPDLKSKFNSVQSKNNNQLIQEIPSVVGSAQQSPRSILKNKKSHEVYATQPNSSLHSEVDPHIRTLLDAQLTTPTWRWSLEKPGPDVVITISIDIPDMVRSAHSQSTLSLSTDILTLRSPKYFLQIPLNNQNVRLPPNRIVDIDEAKAEWRIAEKSLVVSLRCASFDTLRRASSYV